MRRADTRKRPRWRHRIGVWLTIGSIGLLVCLIAGFAIEMFRHFQLQYFAASVVLLLAMLLTRRSWWLLAPCVSLIVSGMHLAPLWFDTSRHHAAGSDHVLRILEANVLTSNEDPRRLLDLIAEESPDIIVLQEINSRWLSDLAPLESAYPFHVYSPREDNFGIVLMSRLPLQDPVVKHAGDKALPYIHAQIQNGERTFDLIAMHTVPPVARNMTAHRNAQLRDLGRLAANRAGPIVVIGDLNTTMWTNVFRSLCRDGGLFDARRGFGVLPTWPANLPAIMRIPIDHCLISDDIVPLNCRVGPDIGSDHLPLIVDLAVAPAH